MHIAICFWGLLRALQYTVDNIHKEILLPIQSYGHTYDIYIHTYSLKGVYRSERNNETGKVLNVSDWKLLSPQYIHIEDQDTFDEAIQYPLYETQGDPWHNNFSSFKNHVRALNSLYQVTKAVEGVVKYHESIGSNGGSGSGGNTGVVGSGTAVVGKKYYDAILFLRPDVHFLQELPIQLLATLPIGTGLESKKPVLFLPDFHRSCHGTEYNDRFAFGTLSAGLTYGKKLESAYNYSLHYKLHAEKFTRWYLHDQKHVKVIEIPFRFRRVRSTGEIHIRDYEVTSPDEHDRYVKQGVVYTGKVRPTSWYIRWFYTFLEYTFITFHQVYIWNHDDNGNLYCDPHHKLTNTQIKRLKKVYPPIYPNLTPSTSGSQNSGTNSGQNSVIYYNKINPNHFECEYIWEDRPHGLGYPSKNLIPVKCHHASTSSSGHNGGPSGSPALGKHHYHSTPPTPSAAGARRETTVADTPPKVDVVSSVLTSNATVSKEAQLQSPTTVSGGGVVGRRQHHRRVKRGANAGSGSGESSLVNNSNQLNSDSNSNNSGNNVNNNGNRRNRLRRNANANSDASSNGSNSNNVISS